MSELIQDVREVEKEAMKALRADRRQTIQAVARRVKEQNRAVKALQELLLHGHKTVPELTEASGMTSSEVMWLIAALKKYGYVAEGEKDGSYFRYTWTGGKPE
jgi:DNA-binding transcriptional ArsR family regulator